MTIHVVPSDTFDALASGHGDMLGVLRAGQRSKRLLLLRELRGTSRSCRPDLFAAAGTAEAFAVLAEARRQAPEAVDDLLLHPHLGAWVSQSLRALLTDGDISPEDLGHLGAVAAVAARRAHRAFEVTAAVRDGSLMLPGLGSVALPAERGWCRIRSADGDDAIEVDAAGTTTAVSLSAPIENQPSWMPLRRLTSSVRGVAIDVRLDDVDPYRGCGHLPIADRLDAAVVEYWQSQLDQAWSLVVEDDRPRAEAISTGLSTIVPLRSTEERGELSATCHTAIGAFAMTPPGNPLTVALALVHEFQHNKLSALLDLVALLEPSPDARVYSPWRADPRPWRGVLQGAYAYLGLAEFWHIHRARSTSSGEPDKALARFEFALAREQVGRGLGALRASGELTQPGIRFVDGMARQLSDLDELRVPPRPWALARLACEDHATSWRLRNVRLDPDGIEGWAEAWRAGRNCSWSTTPEASIVDGRGPLPSTARFALTRQRLSFPSGPDTGSVGATAADVLLLDGRAAEAADTYRSQLARDPEDLASWAGLALARREAVSGATWALAECPETVLALHCAIRRRDGTEADVEELAIWMATGATAAVR